MVRCHPDAPQQAPAELRRAERLLRAQQRLALAKSLLPRAMLNPSRADFQVST
jgi:hypothetical protein